jgi:prolipoprotein diacylglyceryltransferase
MCHYLQHLNFAIQANYNQHHTHIYPKKKKSNLENFSLGRLLLLPHLAERFTHIGFQTTYSIMPSLVLPSSPDYYLIFYVAGFAVAGILLTREAYVRQYAWRRWLPLLAGTMLCLILSTRLVAGSGTDWQHLLIHGEWTGPDSRSILGGMLGATLALALLRRVLGFGRDVYDAFALPLFIGLAFQGVGCLLTGCCFGIPTASSVGVCYAPHTLPFLTQVAQGMLPTNAAHSLPVHPAQFYQILLCLLIAGILGLSRRRQPAPGQQFLLAILLYAAGRFGLEFVRDSAGDVLGSPLWHDLKQVQWFLLLAVSSLVGLWLYRGRSIYQPSIPALLGHWRPRLVLGGLLLITALLSTSWLTVPEQVVVKSLLLASLVLEAGLWLRGQSGRSPQLVGLPVLLGGVLLLLTSQAPAPNSRRYTTISAGGLAGTSEQYFGYPYGCSGTQRPTSTYRQQFAMGTVGVARTWPLMRASTVTVGANVGVGRSNFRPQQDTIYVGNYSSNFDYKPFERGHAQLLSFSPYIEVAHPKYVRIGLGFHLGDVAYDYVYKPGIASHTRMQFLTEVGLLNIAYVHTSINYGLQGLGNGFSTLGLGTGAGTERFRLVGGVAIANSENNAGLFDRTDGHAFPFLQAQIPVGEHWTLEPFAATNFSNIQSFQLQANFRLPSRAPADSK